MKVAPPTPIEAGMTLTNEPGYYCAGRYGIRSTLEERRPVIAAFYAWAKTRDETSTGLTFVAVALAAHNKYVKVAIAVLIVWLIYQMIQAMS